MTAQWAVRAGLTEGRRGARGDSSHLHQTSAIAGVFHFVRFSAYFIRNCRYFMSYIRCSHILLFFSHCPRCVAVLQCAPVAPGKQPLTSMTVVSIIKKQEKEYARRLFRLFIVESEGCAVSGMSLGEAVMRGNSACAGHLSDSAGAGRALEAD